MPRKKPPVSIEKACAELGVSPARRLLDVFETSAALGYRDKAANAVRCARRRGDIAGDCRLPGRGGWRFDVREVWRYAQELRARSPRAVTS